MDKIIKKAKKKIDQSMDRLIKVDKKHDKVEEHKKHPSKKY